MAKSLLEQLPEIVANGRKQAEKILEGIESRHRVGLQTREVVLPARDTKAQDWIAQQSKANQLEVFAPGQASLVEGSQATLGATPEATWTNRLIYGDNLLAMAALLAGDENTPSLRGKVDLIYIDPPFDSKADYRTKVTLPGVEIEQKPTVIEQFAYSDTWSDGTASYLAMITPRLILMRELLADTGSIYVHLDWHVGHYVKIILDEIFGKRQLRNEIVWCYYNGAGVDNVKITTKTLSDADSCASSVGNGCGTHNELGTSTSSYTHPATSAAEHEFTILHAGALPNTTYYFRAYDVTNNLPVYLNTGKSDPSLSTKGADMSFSTDSLPAGTVTEGVTTDISTTPTTIAFNNLQVGTEIKAAQRLSITTDAPKGYQVFVYSRQGLLGTHSEIQPITSTNAAPAGWSTACSALANSCFGYHSGDDSLENGSGRFAADDSYARLATSSEEVAFSSFPVTNDVVDIIYRIKVNGNQEAGLYEGGIVYIIVPRF